MIDMRFPDFVRRKCMELEWDEEIEQDDPCGSALKDAH
jgi:hypothetical protein